MQGARAAGDLLCTPHSPGAVRAVARANLGRRWLTCPLPPRPFAPEMLCSCLALVFSPSLALILSMAIKVRHFGVLVSETQRCKDAARDPRLRRRGAAVSGQLGAPGGCDRLPSA